MKKNMKILFATNFTPASHLALQTCLALEKEFHARISLIYVFYQTLKDWFRSGVYHKQAAQRLHVWRQIVRERGAEVDEVIMEKGQPDAAILAAAKKVSADLILLGGGKRGSDLKFRTGSIAKHIVRNAIVPVWVCKSRGSQRVLCAVDGSVVSEKALEYSLTLCRAFNAKLTVLSVMSLPGFNPLGMEEDEINKHETEFQEKCQKDLQPMLSGFDFTGVPYEISYLWGIPSQVILNVAEDMEHDLVVMGATGHGKFAKALIGTTAEKVLQEVPCSLLVVR